MRASSRVGTGGAPWRDEKGRRERQSGRGVDEGWLCLGCGWV